MLGGLESKLAIDYQLLSGSPITKQKSFHSVEIPRRKMSRQNVRALALVLCALAYLFAGAALFHTLESEPESIRDKVVAGKQLTVKRKHDLSEDDYNEIRALVLLAKPHRAGRQWKFAGSFYFAMNVITTIGKFCIILSIGFFLLKN